MPMRNSWMARGWLNWKALSEELTLTADPAFSAFYRRFVPTLVSFLMWQGARLADAADIAQVTMSQAYTFWSTIREPEMWARRLASRELARRIARVEEPPANEMPEHTSLLSPLPDVILWEQHEVMRVLAQLSPRQRQVMAWSLDSYTPAEIAQELRLTSEEVLENLTHARKTLAQNLDTTEDER
jgi:RNA polymerase sigma factor (sigma-70 family)